MAASSPIRRVNVEFLRPGRSHNQLLSPYTQYLAVCNDAGAGVVTVPYEHRVFERRLKELRYETGDQSDRLNMLHELGTDIGRVLEAVPGLTGALANSGQAATLVHLRLTLSAAELALLPFELAQVPVGSSGSALSIQTRPPVSVTRHAHDVLHRLRFVRQCRHCTTWGRTADLCSPTWRRPCPCPSGYSPRPAADILMSPVPSATEEAATR